MPLLWLIPMGLGAASTGIAYAWKTFNNEQGTAVPLNKDYLGSQTGALATIQIVSVAAIGIVGVFAVMKVMKK